MSDALTLADAAQSARSHPRIVVPDYRAIVTGSRALRALAWVFVLLVIPLWLFSIRQGDQVRREYVQLQAAIQKIDTAKATQPDDIALASLERQAEITQSRVTSAAWSCGLSFAGGLVVLGIVAVLRMIAFLAIAVRDGARNTFYLQAMH